MKIRKYDSKDAKETMELFYQTVHHINIQDYNESQVEVWAPKQRDIHAWDCSLLKNHSYVVEEEGVIVAFGDIEDTGYLDRFYVHHLHNGKGIGRLLVEHLEKQIEQSILTTHASITAVPFFERLGYKVKHSQIVKRGNVEMINYVMEKNKRIK